MVSELVLLILNPTVMTKLAILAFLSCGEFVKNCKEQNSKVESYETIPDFYVHVIYYSQIKVAIRNLLYFMLSLHRVQLTKSSVIHKNLFVISGTRSNSTFSTLISIRSAHFLEKKLLVPDGCS